MALLPTAPAKRITMFKWLLRTALKHIAMRQARRQVAEFEAATHRPRDVQDELLRRILDTQRDTQFGRDHRFHEIRSLADFRRNLSIRRYEEFEPYIAQMRQGKLDALVSAPMVHMFALTSGTTATRKFIPVTPQYLADYRRGWTIWGMTVAEKYTPRVFRGILQFFGDWDEFRTEAGIPCGSVSGLTAHMQRFVIRWMYCMPAITAKIKDSAAKYYTALRLALPRDVTLITTANPSTLVNFARFADQEKESLIRDLYDGALSSRFAVPAEVRAALHRKLSRRHRRRAKELEAIVSKTGTLYPKDCWPSLKLIGNWTGGSVGSYLRFFPRYYGETPVRDLGLIASEGRMSIPIEDGTKSGVLDITSHFYEFIPQEEIDDPQPTVLRAHELDVGKDYFILLTTAFGLYRYNIYDLVRVTGFHNRTPLIEFLNKGANFSNLTGEKLSEFQVVQAVQEAARELDLSLFTYAVAPCWEDETPHYGLLVEQGDLGGLAPGRDLAAAVDRHLRTLNIEYDAKRESGRLGVLRLLLLPSGAWSQWDRQRLERTGGTPEQYKHPCLIPDTGFCATMPVLQEIDAPAVSGVT
jgi:hypothetical protein